MNATLRKAEGRRREQHREPEQTARAAVGGHRHDDDERVDRREPHLAASESSNMGSSVTMNSMAMNSIRFRLSLSQV
jgi:hypothetical protein